MIVGVGARVGERDDVVDRRRPQGAAPAAPPRSTVTVPDGAELDIPGISPLFTSNRDFYRVDTALTVPSVDPAAWRLMVDGMVDRRIELSFDDLVGMGLDEYAITLTCVSNEVGGELLGNATWLGVPVRDVLRLAGPQSGADMVLSRSIDGFTAGTPLEALTDDGLDAILAVGMNGEPLPLEHGFPVRMVVPGLYGYVSATKWLTELKVTTFDADEAYWTPRGYSARGADQVVVAHRHARARHAVAAGPTIDRRRRLGADRGHRPRRGADRRRRRGSRRRSRRRSTRDTWVQWFLEWDATPGTHYVAVRATDQNGDLQVEERAPIAPDGSTGWQRKLLQVS